MNYYKLVVEGNIVFDIDQEEFDGFKKKRATTGKQFPYFVLKNQSYVFMDRVIAIIPSKAIITPDVVPEDVVKEEDPNPDPEVVEAEVVEEETPKLEIVPTMSKEAKDKEAMAEMLAKSTCTHKEVSLHFQKTKKGTRYFPVCDFCGHRGRYIASDSVTEEEVTNAIEWKEK